MSDPGPLARGNPDLGQRLLLMLSSLNHFGAAINRIGATQGAGIDGTLRLIVESATEVLPGVSAALCPYDLASGTLNRAGWVVAADASHPPALRDLLLLEGDEFPSDLPNPAERVSQLVSTSGHDYLCYPLIVGNLPLAALYIYLPEGRVLDQFELAVLDTFVNQAAMAIHQAHQLTDAQRILARKDDELARLRRADLLISSRLSLEDTLVAILQMALEVTEARYGIFRLVDRSGQHLITAAYTGDDLGRPAVEALPVNTTSIMGWVAKHRQPLCIADLRANPWARVYYPLDLDLEMRSELAVPLIGASGRLEGVLNLESPVVGAFTEEDSHLLQALATQAVIAIQEARLLDALQEMAERLLSQPPQAVFERLADLACELLNVPLSNIWLVDGEELILQACSDPTRIGHRISLRDSFTGLAVLTGQPVAAQDVRSDPRFAQRPLAVTQGWSSALAVPLLAGPELNHVVSRGDLTEIARPLGASRAGVFSVYSAQADVGRFGDDASSRNGVGSRGSAGSMGASDWDRKVLLVLAHHATLAIQEDSRREALRAVQEQRAVAETFAAIGDIAANLLHRVNNKIGTIPVRIEGIQDKSRPSLQTDPYLASNLVEITTSAAEAMQIMRDSLIYLRPIHLQPVSVKTSVDEAIAEASLPPGIELRLEGLEELPMVMAGSRRLALVFSNLLENAATAMRGKGSIIIRGNEAHGVVMLTISDTGPGIPPELQERVFELDFSRGWADRQARQLATASPIDPVDQSGDEKRLDEGSLQRNKLGFGLWWVKTLVTRFGGSVAVESDGQHGTTFILRLPGSIEQPG